MKKNFIAGVVVGGLIFGSIGAFAGQYVATENPFPVQLNGKDVSVEGYNIEGSTYFKLRDIADVIGGFDVGFANDTIQLSKDGYSYMKINRASDNTTDSSETGIKYYSNYKWCPDFGAYTGAVLIDTIKKSDHTVYVYDLNTGSDYTKYFDLLLEVTDLSLNPASTGTLVDFYSKSSKHGVSCMLSESNNTVNIMVED